MQTARRYYYMVIIKTPSGSRSRYGRNYKNIFFISIFLNGCKRAGSTAMATAAHRNKGTVFGVTPTTINISTTPPPPPHHHPPRQKKPLLSSLSSCAPPPTVKGNIRFKNKPTVTAPSIQFSTTLLKDLFHVMSQQLRKGTVNLRSLEDSIKVKFEF